MPKVSERQRIIAELETERELLTTMIERLRNGPRRVSARPGEEIKTLIHPDALQMPMLSKK